MARLRDHPQFGSAGRCRGLRAFRITLGTSSHFIPRAPRSAAAVPGCRLQLRLLFPRMDCASLSSSMSSILTFWIRRDSGGHLALTGLLLVSRADLESICSSYLHSLLPLLLRRRCP